MLALLLALVFWAVVHSLTADARSKRLFQQRLGDRVYAGTYRLLYNVFSLLSILPLFYLLTVHVPERVLWSVPMPFRLLNYAFMLVGILGLALSLWQTDVWEFIGLRQFNEMLRGNNKPNANPSLIVTGTYALVRHPLYLFSLLFIWARPVLTLQSLLFNIWVTAYFVIGSYFEEKRLVAIYGDNYRAYRERVPRLLPSRQSLYSALSIGR